MHVHPSRLLDYLNVGHVIEMGSDRSEVRMLSGVVVGLSFYQLAEPATYIALIEQSMTYKVASLLHSHLWMSFLFFLAASMLLPLVYVLAFRPDMLRCKLPRKMAALAAIIGAVLWALMTVMSIPIDADWVTTVFALRAIVDLGFGLLYGISLNAQHAREAREDLERLKALGAFRNDE